jgi:tRNA G10  N-methylase Trm11
LTSRQSLKLNSIPKILLILDPFCGKATILTEFLNSSLKRAYFLAGDADLEQTNLAQDNIGNCQRRQECDLIESNLTGKLARLPYRDRLFDLIITDLPFEKNHPVQFFDTDRTGEGSNGRGFFYRCVLDEFCRLLSDDGGVLVVLVNSEDVRIFEEAAHETQNKGLKIVSSAGLSLGQTTATMFKLLRYGL